MEPHVHRLPPQLAGAMAADLVQWGAAAESADGQAARPESLQVAFLGLGAMGAPMALNLARAGFSTRAWNRTPRDYPDLAEAGVVVHSDPVEATQNADIVCVCVLHDQAVEDALMPILPHLKPGCMILDHSTIGLTTATRMAALAAERKLFYLDAPVSGGQAGAEAASLTIMVGGDRAAFDRAQPVLNGLGRMIEYMGPSGSGATTKLVNQLLTAVHQAVATEALNLASQAGLKLDRLLQVLATSYGFSRMLERTVPEVLSGRFVSSFTIDVLAKDLGLVDALGKELGVSLPVMDRARERYGIAQQAGLGSRDAAALIKTLADRQKD